MLNSGSGRSVRTVEKGKPDKHVGFISLKDFFYYDQKTSCAHSILHEYSGMVFIPPT